MEKIKIAVCDDEKLAQDLVSSALISIFESHTIAADIERFDTVGDLSERMKSCRFDLLMLDIEMPGGNGIVFGQKLVEDSSAVDIIYVSSKEEKVFETFSARPFGFVRKSNFMEDINAVITNYIKQGKLRKVTKKLLVRTKGGDKILEFNHIIYIEGCHNSQMLHMLGNETLETNSSLSVLSEKLASEGFYRSHKGFIINFYNIKGFDGNSVIMKDDSYIPVSRGSMKELKTAYLNYVKNAESVITL